MSELPNSWVTTSIGVVAEVFAGRTPSRFEARLEASQRGGRTVPFYKVGDMNAAPTFMDDARVLFAKDEAKTFGITILSEGSVVFPKAGGAIATNKKRIIRTPGGIDLNCMSVTAKERILPRFLFYFFDRLDLTSLSTGSVLPQIGKKAVESTCLSLPPLAEQQRIVEILEEQFSRLDAALTSIRTVREKAAAFRRSLLQVAFGNLETDGILLGEVATVIDCEHKTAPKTGGAPFAYSLGTSSIRSGTIRFERSKPISQATYEEWTARQAPEEGDLVLTREAPMGEVAIVPDSPLVALGQRTVLVHLDKEAMSPKFVHLVLLSPRTASWIASHSVGTTVQHLNVADVKKIPLGELPTLLEQERIVQTVETDLSRLEAAVAICNQLEARIASERRSLLHAAFSGALTEQWRTTHNG